MLKETLLRENVFMFICQRNITCHVVTDCCDKLNLIDTEGPAWFLSVSTLLALTLHLFSEVCAQFIQILQTSLYGSKTEDIGKNPT